MNRYPVILFTVVILTMLSCKERSNENPGRENSNFWIGTYSRNNSEGIYRAGITPEGKFTRLTAVTQAQDPSFLVRTTNNKFLLAVNELESGKLTSYKITGDTLQPVSTIEAIGTHPCHISLSGDNTVVVSNYSSGDIALFSLDDQGHLTEIDKLNFTGHGPHSRQEAPHAHSTRFLDPAHLLSADLGTDKLWISTIERTDSTAGLQLKDSITLAPGAGPRHMAFHPGKNWIYVINELSSTINLIKPGIAGEAYSVAPEISTLPDNFNGENYCADIHIDQTGNFLYASNRGHQSIAIFSIDQENGNLSPVGFETVHGDWPRNFSITPDNNFIIVANERSNNLVSFRRDLQKGTLTYVDEIKVPAPVCIAF